jgi:DNA-binding protein HU-beta
VTHGSFRKKPTTQCPREQALPISKQNNFFLFPNHILLEEHNAQAGRKSMAKTTANPKAGGSVTIKNLAASLAAEHDLTKRAGQEFLNDLVTLITKHLKRGERIRIAHLGILQVKNRAARMGRNPATGEPIKIKASRRVAFRPTKEMKLAA